MINLFHKNYEIYGNARSPVWFIGLEPYGKEGSLPDKSRKWPMSYDFKLGSRSSFTRYESSCMKIAECCFNNYSYKAMDRTVFRANMFPLQMPKHRKSTFNKLYRNRLGVEFSEYKEQCFKTRVDMLRKLMLSTQDQNFPFRIVIFQGKPLRSMAQKFASDTAVWKGSRGFVYTYDSTLNSVLISAYHTSYPRWRKAVIDGINNNWVQFQSAANLRK